MDLTKNSKLLKVRSIKDVPSKMRTSVYTHIWNKILRSRDFYVSKAFKERLNYPSFHKELKSSETDELSPWTVAQIEFQSSPIVGLNDEADRAGIR
jgi:hypothetical protein